MESRGDGFVGCEAWGSMRIDSFTVKVVWIEVEVGIVGSRNVCGLEVEGWVCYRGRTLNCSSFCRDYYFGYGTNVVACCSEWYFDVACLCIVDV